MQAGEYGAADANAESKTQAGKMTSKSQRKRQAQVGKAGVAKINAERKAQAGEDGEQEVRRRLEKIVWQRPTRT